MNNNICYICGAEYERFGGRWRCPACDAYKPEEMTEEESVLLFTASQKLRNNSFAEAEDKYTDIISRFPHSSEAYWGRLCARFGIKYERDYDGKYIPTCYAGPNSILGSMDYKRALEHSTEDNRRVLENEAKRIESIRTLWMDKVKGEKPYDIFISFKDSDKEHGIERTRDSELAFELYHELSSKGYRVFFSRVSLRDKAGEEYEPYIYNALRTSRAMILFGSEAEYFHSTWLKNEWTRYLRMMKDKEKADGSLILVLNGVEAGDLPRELRSRQYLEWGTLTFLKDLTARLSRILAPAKEEPKAAPKAPAATAAPTPKPAAAPAQKPASASVPKTASQTGTQRQSTATSATRSTSSAAMLTASRTPSTRTSSAPARRKPKKKRKSFLEGFLLPVLWILWKILFYISPLLPALAAFLCATFVDGDYSWLYALALGLIPVIPQFYGLMFDFDGAFIITLCLGGLGIAGGVAFLIMGQGACAVALGGGSLAALLWVLIGRFIDDTDLASFWGLFPLAALSVVIIGIVEMLGGTTTAASMAGGIGFAVAFGLYSALVCCDLKYVWGCLYDDGPGIYSSFIMLGVGFAVTLLTCLLRGTELLAIGANLGCAVGCTVIAAIAGCECDDDAATSGWICAVMLYLGLVISVALAIYRSFGV